MLRAQRGARRRAPRRSSCCADRRDRGGRARRRAQRVRRVARGAGARSDPRARARRDRRGSRSALQRWPEATAALEAAVDRDARRATSARAARCSASSRRTTTRQLGDAPRAIAAYRRLLEADPSTPGDDPARPAPRSRGSTRRASSWPELRDVMRKQAEWAEDAGERRALLAPGRAARRGAARRSRRRDRDVARRARTISRPMPARCTRSSACTRPASAGAT